MYSRRFQRSIRVISVPIAFAFAVILYREIKYNNEVFNDGEYELVGLNSNLARPIKNVLQNHLSQTANQGNPSPIHSDDPRVISMLQADFGVKNAPIPGELNNPLSPVRENPISPFRENPVSPVRGNPLPQSPSAHEQSESKLSAFARVQGRLVEHGIMNQDEVKVEVKHKVELDELPPDLKLPVIHSSLSEDRDYVDDVSWPDASELDVPGEFIEAHPDFYGKGRNRDRQQRHGSQVPVKRAPDLIITGAKKCGTTALKIFMNYHPWFQDNVGERHFFNRLSNFKNGYDWYIDQMPWVFEDEVCYEKTPDYFDRPFVPERMSHLNNSDSVKFIHVLCDPVRRSFSHFLHMFEVQSNPKFSNGAALAQGGFEFLDGNFGDIPREEAFDQTIQLALKSLLDGKDIDTVTDEEIRDSVNDYFTRWDKKPGDPRRVFPLRAPDAMLTGSLYSIHIRTFLHYFRQDQMLYLDATELIENPGKSLRRVAQFMGVPAIINENNFYFDDEKGYYCMTPPAQTGRASFCLGSNKGRSKDKELPDKLKDQIRRFFRPFLEDLTSKYSGETYEHWDW